MRDKLTPLFTLIGVVYIKSIDLRYTEEYRNDHKKVLAALVKEYHDHLRNATEPDIQIIKK